MPSDNPEVAKIEVPHVSRPEVDLGKEYQRVKKELGRLRQELSDSGNQLLADQVEIEESSVHVRYNPNPARSVPVIETIPLEKEFMYLYGEYQYLGGSGESSMLGLQEFILYPSGYITVSVFEQDDKKRRAWSARRPASSDLFNQALIGLVSQYDELEADFEKRPIVEVTVPQLIHA